MRIMAGRFWSTVGANDKGTVCLDQISTFPPRLLHRHSTSIPLKLCRSSLLQFSTSTSPRRHISPLSSTTTASNNERLRLRFLWTTPLLHERNHCLEHHLVHRNPRRQISTSQPTPKTHSWITFYLFTRTYSTFSSRRSA